MFVNAGRMNPSRARSCSFDAHLHATKVSPILTPSLSPLLPSVKPLTTAPLPSSTSSRISPSG